jgi:hypothetical protein
LTTPIAIALTLAVASPAPLESQGTVVVAKAQGDAIILWDVTPAVAPLVAQPETADAKVNALATAAGKILVDRAKELSRAVSVTIRVLYQKTGDVSPLYRTATFLGVEKVLEVTASRQAAAHNADAWAAELAKGVVPSGMTVKVTGALPPPQ